MWKDTRRIRATDENGATWIIVKMSMSVDLKPIVGTPRKIRTTSFYFLLADGRDVIELDNGTFRVLSSGDILIPNIDE